MNQEPVASLSDNENDGTEMMVDKLTSLSPCQRDELVANGYCILDNKYDISAVQGYIRNNFEKKCLVQGIIKMVIDFYSARYNERIYAELVFVNKSSTDQIESESWLVPKINLKLCKFLHSMAASSRRIEIDSSTKVKPDFMHKILGYLNHHKGIEPKPIPSPIPSSNMKDFVDEWDAKFVDQMDKQTIKQIINTSNYLDCKCLISLCCAKIATFIRHMPVAEVKKMLANR